MKTVKTDWSWMVFFPNMQMSNDSGCKLCWALPLLRVHVLLNERARYCFLSWPQSPMLPSVGGRFRFYVSTETSLYAALERLEPIACSKHLNANPLTREAMRGVEVMFKCAFTWMLCSEVHQLLKSLVPGCIGKIKKTFFFVATDDLGWKFTTLSLN